MTGFAIQRLTAWLLALELVRYGFIVISMAPFAFHSNYVLTRVQGGGCVRNRTAYSNDTWFTATFCSHTAAHPNLVAPVGFEPTHLSVLGFESSVSARFHHGALILVHEAGVEPARSIEHYPLKVACLPFHHSCILVLRAGVEPARLSGHMILNHTCLPFHHLSKILVAEAGVEPARPRGRGF